MWNHDKMLHCSYHVLPTDMRSLTHAIKRQPQHYIDDLESRSQLSVAHEVQLNLAHDHPSHASTPDAPCFSRPATTMEPHAHGLDLYSQPITITITPRTPSIQPHPPLQRILHKSERSPSSSILRPLALDRPQSWSRQALQLRRPHFPLRGQSSSHRASPGLPRATTE